MLLLPSLFISGVIDDEGSSCADISDNKTKFALSFTHTQFNELSMNLSKIDRCR